MIEEKAKPKQYYRFWVLPRKWLRVRYDRLALLALLDRYANCWSGGEMTFLKLILVNEVFHVQLLTCFI